MASNASVATEAIFDIPALRPERKNLLVGEPPQTRCFGPSWPEVVCFTGRLFILCDARILHHPAIQWASASTPSAVKSSCRSGWQWDISRMTMSRNGAAGRRCIKKQAPTTGACLVNIAYLNRLEFLSEIPPPPAPAGWFLPWKR